MNTGTKQRIIADEHGWAEKHWMYEESLGYDLKEDPQELNNRHGDPTAQKQIRRLKRRLTALKKHYGVPAR